ncbi:PucR family transcriptional regulator [Nocardia sp. alder85J]|uniref:PucR family transcriptional regulator n=1 Tax=Nocardia sp. alder85J TaxID=2862949 RepID=UPI001CD46035|nr:PucR family transcriptional regulator [Nocardia sp. alder85J]MCX4092407.1 PucR family transcriptional regulator [Nocardia sp. alder85J]
MTPAVSLRWVLAQSDLGLRLRSGDQGLDHPIDLVLTTELSEPFPWLAGGELVLTTGLRLPASRHGRTAYLHGLQACGVAGLGFGTGLSHPEIPADVIRAADRIGLPLLEVPLPTPFAAIIRRVSERLAELRYEEALRASRAQPRITRAVVDDGAPAVVRELATALDGRIVMLDRAGAVLHADRDDSTPELPAEVESADSGVSTDSRGETVTWQQIAVGRRRYGVLIAITGAPLSNVGRILLGHAGSLLALDFAKSARLASAQQALNTRALATALGTDPGSPDIPDPLMAAADPRGRIRVLVTTCPTDAETAALQQDISDAFEDTELSRFTTVAGRRTIVVLPASDGVPFAHRLSDRIRDPLRRAVRIGISAAHPLARLADAVDAATLAAAAAVPGTAPVEFGATIGTALLASTAGRDVLDTIATVLDPLLEHDREHGSDLFGSLRAFLEANGHWESAAAELGVHRHTMRSRLATVRSILDCDLDLARVRAELLLAILSHSTRTG